MDETIMAALLPKAKTALRISESNTDFDEEIKDILTAGYLDLSKTAGINMANFFIDNEFDALLLRAILTYTRFQFGEPSDFERLEKSYWIQKAQLQSCSGYAGTVLEGD